MSKTQMIRSKLRDDIVSGRYEPGGPIPERAVAEELAVSRIPVREALIQLERDGLVSILPRRGAYVRAFTAENMRSLYEAREALEGMAARLAAERFPEDSLTSLMERYRSVLDDPGSAGQASITALGHDFHDAVIYGSRNSVLIEMSTAIADRVTICRRMSYRRTSHELALRAGEEHVAIAEAIQHGDGALAERRMREHISTWARLLANRMAGDRPGPAHVPADSKPDA